jgi:hypothetical protein
VSGTHKIVCNSSTKGREDRFFKKRSARHWFGGSNPFLARRSLSAFATFAYFLFKNVFSAFVVSAQRYSAALNQPDAIPNASTNMLFFVG